MSESAGRMNSTVQSENEFIILPFRSLDKLWPQVLPQEKISLLKRRETGIFMPAVRLNTWSWWKAKIPQVEC